MSQEPRGDDGLQSLSGDHGAPQPQSDLASQIQVLTDLFSQEKEQESLRNALGDETEKFRVSERESPSKTEVDYDHKMREMLHAQDAAKDREFSLRKQRAEKLLDVTKTLVASDSFKARFNPYERYILTQTDSRLGKHPYAGIQDIALNVLSLATRGEHITEKDAIEHALVMQKKEYRELSKQYKERYPDNPLSELLYAIKYCPQSIYGDKGVQDNLIRRVISIKADEILELSYAKIPPEFTINRAFIKQMIQLCVSGAYPEWSGDRFLDKIESHSDKPYSDEEFKTKAPVLREQAEKVAKKLSEAVPSLIAVGVTGSLARPDFFGFNPHSSDIDLLIYNHGGIHETKQINDYVKPLVDEGIPICLGAAMDDNMGNSQPPWALTTPKNIEVSLELTHSPDDAFFDMSAFLVSSHHEGIILSVNNREMFDTVFDKPLMGFFQSQIIPLQRQTIQLFRQLDG
jgi:hypothetical protein